MVSQRVLRARYGGGRRSREYVRSENIARVWFIIAVVVIWLFFKFVYGPVVSLISLVVPLVVSLVLLVFEKIWKPMVATICGLVLLGLLRICWNDILPFLRIFIYRTPLLSDFWRQWTIQPHRFGWQSLNEPQQSNSQPQSDENSKSDYRTSSNLCRECFRVIDRSGLLVGSISFFTPRVEWHNWLVSLHGLDLDSSQEFCHLCNIFWNSIPETRRRAMVTRNDLGISDTGQVQIDQTIQLRIKIWEDYEGLWYDEHRRYMEVYLGEVVQCESFAIREEYLRGEDPSIQLPLWTGSLACISLAKDWIETCHKHQSCRSELPKRAPPTRLVDVGNSNSQIRLHTTTSDETEIKYLALSHCWGKKKITRLTLENQDAWFEKIDYDTLPANFQHAIHFTREIGQRYVWIDSLCIVQNCSEDWGREAKKMSKVYAQAFCTISASGSPDAYGGCFKKRNPLLKFPCNLRFSDQKALMIRDNQQADSDNIFVTEIDGGPLSKRGWTFQERLLSQRIVHFGASFLFFECSTHYASEQFRSGEKYNQQGEKSRWTCWPKIRSPLRSAAVLSSRFDPVTGYRAAFNTLRQSKSTKPAIEKQLQLHKCWFELVAMYTSAELTVPSDRLIAISGIAQGVQGDQNEPEYLAGLWRHHFTFDLLWCLEDSPKERPLERRAPSWSWGVVDGAVCERLLSSTVADDSEWTVAEVCDLKVEESSPGIFQGHVDLKCLLLPVKKRTQCKHGHGFDLIIQGHTREFNAKFTPDIVSLPSELFCAEIVRMVFCNLDTWSVWSHGIVLGQMKDVILGEEDVILGEEPVSYERLGIFWTEWEMSDREVSAYVTRKWGRGHWRNTPDRFLEALQDSEKGSFDGGDLKKIRVI